jgi:gamma-glutamyltranspeptidase/glutathione hydrolase
MAGLMRTFCTSLLLTFGLLVQAAEPYRGGVAATAYPSATKAAIEMLDKGGNAADAAVAAAFVAGVAGPYHNGIGGGGFALVYDAKSKATRVLDFREVAPKGASHDMYLKGGKAVPELSRDGATSVAIPGAVAGYLALLKEYGRLRPEVVLAPAIKLAKEGMWVTPKFQSVAQKRLDCLRKNKDAARIFLRPNMQGQPDVPALGTVLPNPELAQTLASIARDGAAAFYRGKIGQAVARTVHEGGGVLTQEDLERFAPRWREPLRGSYRGHAIATLPPPSAGGIAVLQVLGQLELLLPHGFVRGEVSATHDLIEAMRRSFAERASYLGDPEFVDIPLQRLLSKEHLKDLSSSVDPSRATRSAALLPKGSEAPAPLGEKHTTHLSVLDRDGNAVALTTTLNYYFGSCVVAHGTGVLLNDEMDDFAAQPMKPNTYELVTGEANSIAPGKVPSSSLSPTFVFQKDKPDELMLVVGSPGGPTIPTAVLQVISNVIDQGMDLPRAVAAGRLHEQWLPDVVRIERSALDPSTLEALKGMGHTFAPIEVLGDTEAVLQDPRSHLRYAASDPRGEGEGLGQE